MKSLIDEPKTPVPESTPADTSAQDDLPVTIIEPKSGWIAFDFKELWRYRELLLIFAWRDIAVRYKQTVLGVAWALLQPLATVVVFSLFFARLGESPNQTVPYPVFVFAGVMPWFLFSNIVISASQSVIGNQGLVTKVYFPRLIIPLSAAGPFLLDCFISFLLLLLMMIGYGCALNWSILLSPFLLFALVLVALGVGTFLAALTVNYRDFRYVVPFMIQIWMFGTPAIYMQAHAVLGPQAQLLIPLNPAHGLIAAFRQAVVGEPLDAYALSVSLAVSIASLYFGALYFKRVERDFADVI